MDVREYTITINSANEISITNILGEFETWNLRASDDPRMVLLPDIDRCVDFVTPTRVQKYA